MAFALRQPIRRVESPRALSVCRVHTCVRCQSSVDSSEPCSFVPNVVQICPPCAAQEHALAHLRVTRAPWGSWLARTIRA